MDLRAIREVNTGFGDGLASVFEMIATPFIFGFLGHLLDQKLGTGVLFLMIGALTVFGYECWKVVAKYNADMARHEANAPWNRHKHAAAKEEAANDA